MKIIRTMFVWEKFVELTDKRPNENLTRGVIKDLLEKLRRKREPNVIKLLGDMKVPAANRFLRSLHGIGPKISAFVLRDLEFFFKFWTDELKSEPQNYYLLQPVDRWVRRISELCWSNLNLPDDHDSAARLVVKNVSILE